MGTYVYRVTARKVKCSDGQLANVAVFAYKPTWSGWDADKVNRKWHFQSGCVSSDRMASEGRLTDRVVLGDKDGEIYGDRVFKNVNNLGTFYDDSTIGTDSMPRIDGVTVTG